MNPDTVEAVLKRAGRAKRAANVSFVLAPILFFGLIEVLAFRREIGSPRFEISFLVLIGVAATLVRWTISTYRQITPVHVGKARDLNESEGWMARWRWRLIAAACLSLLIAVITPSDGRFGGWPVVNVAVVLRMLVVPMIATGAVAWKVSQFFVAIEKQRTVVLQIRTTTAQIVALCATLTLLGLVAAGSGIMIGADLKVGLTHSPFGYRKIFLRNSPEAFWTYIELYAFIALSCFTLCVQQIFEVIAQDKRRESSTSQKMILWGFGLVYSALLGAVGWLLILGNSKESSG